MLNFKKRKIPIDDSIKKRISFIYNCCGFKVVFECGNTIAPYKTNSSYVDPIKFL